MDTKPSPRPWAVAVCLAMSACWASADQGSAPPAHATRLRRPVAAAFLDDGHTLCVANQRSGSVSLVDLPAQAAR